MKIAYFADAAPVIGGAGNVLLEQARIMNNIYDVVVALPLDSKEKMNTEYVLRCQKAHLKFVGLRYTTVFRIQDIDIVRAWHEVEAIREWAVSENIDFFHSVQLNIAVELAARKIGIPHLMNIYQLCQEEFVFKYMDIFPRYHSCDSLMYCAMWEKKLRMKTCCIRPSAPLEMIIKKKRKDKNKLNLLMLGGLQKRKNQLQAIKAVEYCIKNGADITLTIAGDDETEYGRICRKYIQNNYLYKKIFLVGFHSNIIPLLLDSDGLLCSSTDESFPSSIVEAMTYGLIVISTPVAGVPELLKDGENAYISSGYGVENISNSIMRCFLEYKGSLARTISTNAELLWKENFCIDIIRKELRDYYLMILNDDSKKHIDIVEKKISKSDVEKVYIKIRDIGKDIPYILERCFYYANLNVILKTGKAYIWGAGKYGKIVKKLIELLFPQVEILAYIDQAKQGEYEKIPIISPDTIEEEIDYIFIGFLHGKDEVIKYLEENGYKYNERVWVLP